MFNHAWSCVCRVDAREQELGHRVWAAGHLGIRHWVYGTLLEPEAWGLTGCFGSAFERALQLHYIAAFGVCQCSWSSRHSVRWTLMDQTCQPQPITGSPLPTLSTTSDTGSCLSDLRCLWGVSGQQGLDKLTCDRGPNLWAVLTLRFRSLF